MCAVPFNYLGHLEMTQPIRPSGRQQLTHTASVSPRGDVGTDEWLKDVASRPRERCPTPHNNDQAGAKPLKVILHQYIFPEHIPGYLPMLTSENDRYDQENKLRYMSAIIKPIL
jgi:hypothetical protein